LLFFDVKKWSFFWSIFDEKKGVFWVKIGHFFEAFLVLKIDRFFDRILNAFWVKMGLILRRFLDPVLSLFLIEKMAFFEPKLGQNWPVWGGVWPPLKVAKKCHFWCFFDLWASSPAYLGCKKVRLFSRFCTPKFLWRTFGKWPFFWTKKVSPRKHVFLQIPINSPLFQLQGAKINHQNRCFFRFWTPKKGPFSKCPPYEFGSEKKAHFWKKPPFPKLKVGGPKISPCRPRFLGSILAVLKGYKFEFRSSVRGPDWSKKGSDFGCFLRPFLRHFDEEKSIVFLIEFWSKKRVFFESKLGTFWGHFFHNFDEKIWSIFLMKFLMFFSEKMRFWMPLFPYIWFEILFFYFISILNELHNFFINFYTFVMYFHLRYE